MIYNWLKNIKIIKQWIFTFELEQLNAAWKIDLDYQLIFCQRIISTLLVYTDESFHL